MDKNMQIGCIMRFGGKVRMVLSLVRKEDKTKEIGKANFFSKTIDNLLGWMYNYARSKDT